MIIIKRQEKYKLKVKIFQKYIYICCSCNMMLASQVRMLAYGSYDNLLFGIQCELPFVGHCHFLSTVVGVTCYILITYLQLNAWFYDLIVQILQYSIVLSFIYFSVLSCLYLIFVKISVYMYFNTVNTPVCYLQQSVHVPLYTVVFVYQANV